MHGAQGAQPLALVQELQPAPTHPTQRVTKEQRVNSKGHKG